MGLITKPPSWGHCTTNLTGTPPSAASLGTSFTSGASNADGSAAAILTNITHDVEFLVIGYTAHFLAASNGSALMDVLIDPAGGSSWATDPLINDLLIGERAATAQGVPVTGWYFFPIWLKSGHSIGVRARTAHTVGIASRVVMMAYGGNAHPSSWWCGMTVESVGTSPTTSQGTDHTAGNTGAFSSWTNLGSTLSKPCGAVQWAVQGANDDTAMANNQYFFEFGVGSTRIGPPFFLATSTSESCWGIPSGPIFCSLPSGTQLQVRGTCSGTAEVLDVAAYAVM